MRKIYLSIGALQAKGIQGHLIAGYKVIAYEPEKRAFAAYQNLKELKPIAFNHFMCFNQAVGSYEGTATLQISGGGDGGCSTILQTPVNHYDEYTVKVVSLKSILEPLEEVEIMNINCEGSEIDIILGTPIEFLVRCKNISIEFHKHYEMLKQTDEMIESCIKKLQERFEVDDHQTYHPYFEFIRK